MSDAVTVPGEEGAEERRGNERVPAHVEVRFEQPSQAARALRAYSLNLSVGGLCVRTQRRYELGAKLSLSMTISGESLRIDAAVAWVRDGAVGLRFENVSAQDRNRLEAIVASLKR